MENVTRMLMSVGGAALVALLLVVVSFFCFENLDSSQLMVIQDPVDGDLHVHTQPGVKWQGFGKVTKYQRRSEIIFALPEVNQKGEIVSGEDTSKRIRFNDGGHASLSGALQWEMPLDDASITAIHRTFGNQTSVERSAVEKMLDLAIYLSGPLMSSTESSGERRSELTNFINDQSAGGPYKTVTKNVKQPDPITGEEKTVSVVEISKDENGGFQRQQSSTVKTFNITLLPISIKEIRYDGIVEGQIAARQKATTEVQIAIANARKAEQDAMTTAKIGEANAAKAKWDQEVIKAKMVTEAQQKLEVATLAAKAAEQTKREQILLGEGEAERKRLVMNADGALDPKLEAYKEVNKYYADAISKYQGNWVPSVIMGGGNGGTSGSGATGLVDLLTAKTARDLGLDLSISGKGNTAK